MRIAEKPKGSWHDQIERKENVTMRKKHYDNCDSKLHTNEEILCCARTMRARGGCPLHHCTISGRMNCARIKDKVKPQYQVPNHTLGKWSQGSIDQKGQVHDNVRQ
jgi:hypothetical protein